MAGEYQPSPSIRGVDPQLLRDLRTAYDLIYRLREDLRAAQARLEAADRRWRESQAGQQAEPQVIEGFGSPEGQVVAPPGRLYLNRQGGAATTLYVKESGQGPTGWVAK